MKLRPLFLKALLAACGEDADYPDGVAPVRRPPGPAEAAQRGRPHEKERVRRRVPLVTRSMRTSRVPAARPALRPTNAPRRGLHDRGQFRPHRAGCQVRKNRRITPFDHRSNDTALTARHRFSAACRATLQQLEVAHTLAR